MVRLFAQPYNINATGFYFGTGEEYGELANGCFDTYGLPVEEFGILFIDGPEIDQRLFEAWGIYQGNVHDYLTALGLLSNHEKLALIALGECGYIIDGNTDTANVDIYYCRDIRQLAEQFIEEGLYGEIPENISSYIDHEKIASDLRSEYTELCVGGQAFVYRCP